MVQNNRKKWHLSRNKKETKKKQHEKSCWEYIRLHFYLTHTQECSHFRQQKHLYASLETEYYYWYPCTPAKYIPITVQAQ